MKHPTLLKALLAAISTATLVGIAEAAPRETYRWSGDVGKEIAGAVFTSRRDEMLLVIKGYEPDGHEAEEYSEKELDDINARAKTNKRWADPNINLLTLSSRKLRRIDYGWNPTATKNNSAVYYTFQLKPISGFRLLADSQEGNQIKKWTRASGKTSVVASPLTGYLDDPLLSPNGKLLAFSKNAPTNGAWGGRVGVGVVDTATKKEVASLKPKKHHGLFDLIDTIRWSGNDKLYVLRHTPKTGGTYLADQYTDDVIDVMHPRRVVPASQQKKFMDGDKVDRAPHGDEFTQAVPSPDGKHAVWLSDNKNVRFVDFPSRRHIDLVVGDVPRNAAWSADSRKCAIITSIYQKGRFERDDLRVFELSKPQSIRNRGTSRRSRQ